MLEDVRIAPPVLRQHDRALLTHAAAVPVHRGVAAGARDPAAVRQVRAPDVLDVPGVTVAVPEVVGFDDVALVQRGDPVGGLDGDVGRLIMLRGPGLAVRRRADVGAILRVAVRGGSVTARGHGLRSECVERGVRSYLRRDDALQVIVHVHLDDGLVRHQHPDSLRDL